MVEIKYVVINIVKITFKLLYLWGSNILNICFYKIAVITHFKGVNPRLKRWVMLSYVNLGLNCSTSKIEESQQNL